MPEPVHFLIPDTLHRIADLHRRLSHLYHQAARISHERNDTANAANLSAKARSHQSASDHFRQLSSRERHHIPRP